MNRHKVMLIEIAAIVLSVFLFSPALAHRRYRPYHKGLPRQVQIRHTHIPSESSEPVVATQSETKGFDLLSGVADIVTGTLETLGNAVEAIFGGESEPASETQKVEPRKVSSTRRNYNFARKHKHPGGIAR